MPLPRGHPHQLEARPSMRSSTYSLVNPQQVSFQQQQQAYQQTLGMQQQQQQQQGSISYPTSRALQPGRGFTSQTPPTTRVILPPLEENAGCNSVRLKEVGKITSLFLEFGFINGDIFFHMLHVSKESLPPKVGEWVLYDVINSPTSPFKWNATRVQVFPPALPETMFRQGFDFNTRYNAVPRPPAFNTEDGFGGCPVGAKIRLPKSDGQEKRREECLREREKRVHSPSTLRRNRSPHASNSPPHPARIAPRYVVQVPKISLDLPEANVLVLQRRYTNMILPPEFFYTSIRWVDAFPANRPLTMSLHPCAFHVMHKEVAEVKESTAILEPADADYSFSAKVMLLSLPGLQEVFRKSCPLAEDMKDGEARDGYVHPTRLFNFLVGVQGKNETMAIGGPWSPSLDGYNPEFDPSVLINTAIRSCKALTGIDLSGCTQWYRFVEIYYRRGESTHEGKEVASRVETVVLFLPDVWSCVPTRLEWDNLQQNYKKQLVFKLKDEQDNAGSSSNGATNETLDKNKLERERQARERRFALPDTPHILVHPSRTAKSGKFDCTVMSLSLLLDYRQEDTKEHSFEVALFAELFNEMLMRDFGFRIYRSLVDAPERPKAKQKEEVEEESNASSGSKKKDEKLKEKEKEKKKENVKMMTIDPGLLLAFMYFDQSHCGYMLDKDVEEILHTLGLNLSRAQCRKLLQKVVTHGTLNYRKLTDCPRDASSSEDDVNADEDAKHQEMLASGNRSLLPVFVKRGPTAKPPLAGLGRKPAVLQVKQELEDGEEWCAVTHPQRVSVEIEDKKEDDAPLLPRTMSTAERIWRIQNNLGLGIGQGRPKRTAVPEDYKH